MEKQLTQFTTMDRVMLMETNGGGFAYDVGRFLRFAILMGGGTNTAAALADWETNAVINEAVNS